MTLTIDGYDFEVGTISLKRNFDIAEKYRVTTESGLMLREVRGVYLKYTLNLRNINSRTYDNLIGYLIRGQDAVTITMPADEAGTITFQAFFTSVSDELVKTVGGINH